MAADILAALIVLNLAAAAAILVVLAARKTVRRLFGARIAYALWTLVPLVAAATLLPARRIIAFADPAPQPAAEAQSLTVTAGEAVTGWAVQAGSQPLVTLEAAMVAAWLAGAGLGLALILIRQQQSIARLGQLRREAGTWRSGHPAVGPAVIGLIAPRIVLPADFDTRFDADEQAVILAHEAQHLAGHDARLNGLATLIQCFCWFNPLVHLAVRRFRTDQELACDEAVLVRFPTQRRTYADALLKTQMYAPPLPLGCYWPARGASPLRERIAMLKHDLPSRARRLTGVALVLAAAAGGSAAAWAAQPATRVLLPAPQPASQAASQAALETEASASAAPTPARPARTAIQRAQAAPAAPPTDALTAPDRTAVARAESRAAMARVVEDQVKDARRAADAARTRFAVAQQGAALRPSFAMSAPSPEDATKWDELRELMKESEADIARQKQIFELSQPSPEERARQQKLRELMAEESARLAKVQQKMAELRGHGAFPAMPASANFQFVPRMAPLPSPPAPPAPPPAPPPPPPLPPTR